MVVAAHKIKEPSWSNTQCWASSYWEVAKCFLPASGYEDKTGVKDTDFNGLVSLLMHCKHFQNNLSFNTADKNSVLWKAREIGRLIRHAAEPKITDQDMETHFNVLLELLEDPKCLRNDAAAKTAARDIQLLQIDDLALSTGEYGDMLRELHHTVTVVTEMIQKGNSQSENIERFIEEVLSSLNQLKSQFTRDLDTVGPVDFQNEMIKYYQNRLCTMPLSPLMPNRDGKLREFCVPLKIKKMGKDGKRLPGREEIHDYQSLFESPVKAEDSKCIIVQGEPGSGKTTFALRTILDWCDALTITSDSNLKSDKSDANPKANTSDANAKVVTSDVKLKAATCDNKTIFGKCGDRNKYFVDLDALKQFKFAFYIPLRHVIDLFDVDKMIKKTLVDKLYRKECQRINSLSLIQDLLSHEYCLVILDGLDEWSHSCYIVPEINLGCKCTCIILTRPWRLAEHPVSDFAIHSRLKITGITDKRLLIKRVLKCLDENDRQIDKNVNALLYEITEKSLDISSPIILMQLICIWHEQRTIGDSLCGIYATMVEMLLKRTKLKRQTLAQDLMQFDCFKNKRFVRENTDLIASLSELAFRQTFSDARETNILFGFDDVVACLTKEQKEFALSSGILSQESTYSLCEDTTTFFSYTKHSKSFLRLCLL